MSSAAILTGYGMFTFSVATPPLPTSTSAMTVHTPLKWGPETGSTGCIPSNSALQAAPAKPLQPAPSKLVPEANPSTQCALSTLPTQPVEETCLARHTGSATQSLPHQDDLTQSDSNMQGSPGPLFLHAPMVTQLLPVHTATACTPVSNI